MRQTRNVIAALLVASALLACAPTPRLISTWSNPSRPAHPYTDLVVFGIAASEMARDAYEDIFVAALQGHGVRARAGHTLVPKGGLASTRTLKKAVELTGAQGVIVTHLRGADDQGASGPTKTHVIPARDGRLYPYYARVYDQVTEPDYYATFLALQLETSLYDGRSEALVWSGRSDGMDPTSEQTTIGEVIDSVTAALASAGYLPSPSDGPSG